MEAGSSFDGATAVSQRPGAPKLPRSESGQRALLADYPAVEARASRHGVTRSVAPVPADDTALSLVEEVMVGFQHVKAQIGQFGPGLAQSGLLALLELRLPETYAHAQRVTRSAVAIGRSLNLSESEVRAVRRAALLHDIGKLAIPARLLGRRGDLVDGEIAVLRLHVTIGAELLREIPTLAAFSPIIAATHERYDGTGYPNRLSGPDIPLAARIITVADCFDAMITRRPYSEPVSRDVAHDELRRCSGSHFDPDIVREWTAMLQTALYPWMVAAPGRGAGAVRHGAACSAIRVSKH